MNVSIRSGKGFDVKDVISRSAVAETPNAEEILNLCLERSIEVRYGQLPSGEIACIWGLIPPTLLSDSAYLWLLTTEIVAEHKFLLVRHSQRYIEEALKVFPTIVGDVLVGNEPAQRWLKWLGAEFEQPVHGRIPFAIRAKK